MWSRFSVFLLLLIGLTASAGDSELYGLRGEKWDPVGRLPDFSYAGYAGRGETPPELPVVADVTTFGATGDGITDDTEAFQAAIDQTEQGAIFIPEGRYRMTRPLYIEKSHLVLRGESQDSTVLFFDASLREVYGENQVWSWNGGFIWVRPPSAPQPITMLSANAYRGDHTVQVDDAAELSASQWVVLSLIDEGTSLAQAIHAGHSVGGDCSWQVPLTFDWPVQVESIDGNTVTLGQPCGFRWRKTGHRR